MAVDLESIRWASDTVIENPTYTDDQGVTTNITVSNKVEPLSQYKDTGALFEEEIPRSYVNYMFDALYRAISDLETRLADLEASN